MDQANRTTVIKMRTALKAGMNWPLKIFTNDDQIIVDENNKGAATKWDDDQGILYYFRLADPDSSKAYQGQAGVLSVSAIKYDIIQAMEACPFPVSDLDKVFDSIESQSSTKFSDEFRDRIKVIFKSLTDPNLVELYPNRMNLIHGTWVANPDIDYYSGNPNVTKFQETAEVRQYNKGVEQVKIQQAKNAENGIGG